MVNPEYESYEDEDFEWAGPLISPEEERANQLRASLEYIEQKRALESELIEKYGERLVLSARVFLGGIENGVIKSSEGWLKAEELSKDFGRALIEGLDNQPTKSRAKWINSLFADINRLEPRPKKT